jgi:hypothetical protein
MLKMVFCRNENEKLLPVLTRSKKYNGHCWMVVDGVWSNVSDSKISDSESSTSESDSDGVKHKVPHVKVLVPHVWWWTKKWRKIIGKKPKVKAMVWYTNTCSDDNCANCQLLPVPGVDFTLDEIPSTSEALAIPVMRAIEARANKQGGCETNINKLISAIKEEQHIEKASVPRVYDKTWNYPSTEQVHDEDQRRGITSAVAISSSWQCIHC